jgi:hypothetical protein
MPSGLPLKEIRTLLNKPGEELDERLKALPPEATAKGGYVVELDGNLEKDAGGEVVFAGSVETLPIPLEISAASAQISTGHQREWKRKGKGDVYMSFWFTVEVK